MTRPGASVPKRLGRLLAAAALALAASVAQAQDPAQPGAGVLVVNQERLIAQSLYGQRIQRELEAASAELSAENRRIEARLTAEELDLTELRDTLTPEEFRRLADEFDARVEAIRAAQEAKARDISEQADTAQVQFFERAAPVLLEIVRDRGAAVLMDSRAVLLSADRVDITETAIAEIDATLGDGGAEPIISVEGGASADAPLTSPLPDTEGAAD
ncbi:OmpH family outer membrane protein [Roseibacterium sp. SDUM158017]|uniref:OmpH family outer membrane protein n=1 Tax=Roseicyclus salinarum TaxID=3036773 RepID=UPI0024154625|nr:OmpH family outer membrane protein [Roseibacterium sp. SDUM158017]MDG4648377.1 OmpH family outer membrane protein [Roseibacterium sp. SDUM158017]